MTLNFLVLQGISDVFSASEISPKWLEISVEFSNIQYKERRCRNNNSWVQSKKKNNVACSKLESASGGCVSIPNKLNMGGGEDDMKKCVGGWVW